MIQAVVFDMGGVLVHTHESDRLLDTYDFMLGWEPGALRMRLYSGPAWESVSTGALSLDAYWDEVGRPLENDLPPEFLGYRDNFYLSVLDLATVHLAWRLRPYFHVGLLSNATDLLVQDIARERHFDGLFDAIAISAVEGVRKPDPDAFLIIAQRLGLSANECVLIDDKIRDFFLVAFSHILKNCSIWLQGSTKPTRDFKKKPTKPSDVLKKHLRKMQRGNNDFYKIVPQKVRKNFNDYLNIKIGSAKHQPLSDNSIDLIITSSPYVTSYEYADLHQLSTIWLDLTDNLTEYIIEIPKDAKKQDLLDLKQFLEKQEV